VNEIIITDKPVEVPANTKAQTWLCTLNNPDMGDEQFYEFLCGLESVKYFIFQRERGEETGTEHLQFYIEFEFARHFKTVKKVLPHGTHIEQRKGTKKQARQYCCKPETRIGQVYEHGELIEERQRTDLHNIIAAIKTGMSLGDLRDDYEAQFFMFQKKFETERAIYLDKKFGDTFRNMNVSYIYGKTGTGKTRSIAGKYGYRNIFRVTEYDQRAFDNYDGQDIIIFEEFRSSFKIAQMLNYLDGHPCRLPCRFVDRTACFTQVFITTNIPLEKQYPNIQTEEPETFKAFIRRIHNIYNYDNPHHRHLLENGEPNPRCTKQLELIPVEDDDLPF
jgi:hypothetical protein